MPLKSSPAKKGSLFDLSSTFIKRPCFLSPNSELGLCGQSSPWVNFLTAWHLQTLRPTGTSEKLTKKHKKEKWGRPHTRVGVCLGLVLCPCSRDRPTALFTCWPHPSSGLGFYGWLRLMSRTCCLSWMQSLFGDLAWCPPCCVWLNGSLTWYEPGMSLHIGHILDLN